MFTTLGCKDKGIKVCGKDSNPSWLAASENILFFYDVYSLYALKVLSGLV